MGGLTRLVLVSMLCGCAAVDCEVYKTVAVDNIEYAIEHVSFFNSSLEKRSRGAAVKVSSYNEFGAKISGSGAYIVYKGKHYILTAAHVIDGSLTAMIEGGKEIIIGEVAFVDSYNDVALISIAGMITKEPLQWRISDYNNVGDNIIYSGYPNSMGLLTLKGTIAGHEGSTTIIHSYVWKGASGSVVLNDRGKIVGVISAVSVGEDIMSFPTIIEDVGLVVPVNSLEEFLKK